MAKGKRSFFERLTGTASIDDYDDVFQEDDAYGDTQSPLPAEASGRRTMNMRGGKIRPASEPLDASMPSETDGWTQEEPVDGELSVDVYQTPDDIVIRAHVAGVRPDDLDIAITRDMVTIKGKREEAREVEDENYFYKELYWGSFSRTILLPQEIEVEEAQATEKHGLLILRLPKVDKEKQTKLKVKSG
ncbi:MAG TPA: Hsp20/alpha crystallin family protein [Candidatus Paceibacterota bacterium]